MPTNNSSNSTNAQYNLIVGTGSAYTSIAPNATIGTPLCSAGNAANPAYSTTPTVTSITITDAPMSGTSGTNKDYVTLVASGFEFKNTTYASTTANLTAVYNNGAAGVGATLTNSGAMAAFSTDGVSPAINSRILVQFQTAAADDGIYTLTTVGSGAANWVLTRAVDYDEAVEIQPGDIVPVANGTLYHDTLWLQTDMVTTVGTDPLNFNQFGGTAISTVQYNSLVGGTSNSIVSVAPTATAGIPLVSTGNASNPSFTTAVVAGGGTGVTSLTPYAPLVGGTTSTNPLQSATTGFNNVGYVFTSTGSSTPPIWQANAAGAFSINIQTFTSNGTYTPTGGMVYCQVLCCGGGGGGGSSGGSGSSTGGAVGGGGGGAGSSMGYFSSSTIGASQTVTIGAGGGAGSSGNTTSLGSLISGSGGAGGGNNGFSPFGGTTASGGGGGSGSGGQVNLNGAQGGNGTCFTGVPTMSFAVSISGAGGGCSLFGIGATSVSAVSNNSAGGLNGPSYGSGASGGATAGSSGGAGGGSGGNGICVVTEYIMT